MLRRLLFITSIVAAAPLSAQRATFVNLAKGPHTVEVNLTAEPTRLSLVPGVESDVFAYNGSIPGPTLELREGDHVIVHFRNRLPVATTVHWHGLHIPFTMDGSPFHPVPPGGEHDYVFTIKKGAAGTYWYHPHPDHTTGYQIAKGLYGVVIVRAADDPLRSLPEKTLVLADNRFLPDGSVDIADPRSPQGRADFENGREGDVIFVNGAITPSIEIRSGEVQRWRIVNASAARVFRLALTGHKFLVVGSDGGLFEQPEEVDDVLIANSERIELLVRGTGKPGDMAVLQSLPYDRYIAQTRPRDWNQPRDLLTLRYAVASTGMLVKASRFEVPTVLRAVAPLDTMQVTARRVVSLMQGMINGKLHDMNRIDISTSLGATEIWEIENLVGMDHPFHLHGFRFQVLDRNGVPEKQLRWKDTVNVPKHETVRFIVRFDDYPGKWMFHCHILDHEDHGMMGVLEIK